MVDLKIELPDEFLDEEIRCDYTVTSQMKEVWAVELDLLYMVLNICKKNNIKIFSFAGTTLGAIRHKGMIPWDDDIDLCMDRENYNKLCEIGPSVFQYPYFFQTEYTDPGSLRGHIQIRRTDTTGILKSEFKAKKRINQGIFIDIFPFDNIPDDEGEENRFRNDLSQLRKKCWIANATKEDYIKSTSKIKTIIKYFYFPIKRLFLKPSRYYYEKLEALCTKYNGIECKRVSPVSFDPLTKRWAMEKSDLQEIIECPFEFIDIPVPKEYDSILKKNYGNYMKFVKGNSVHGEVIFDTSKSYTHYLEKGK